MAPEIASNPADLPLVTLDNNALVSLRREEPAAQAVRDLLALNRAGRIAINITLSTALEAQLPDDQLRWDNHIEWLESLGIAKSNIFTGPRTVGFTTPGAPNTITFDPALEIQLNERIHEILFPTIPFMWRDYRAREGARAGLSARAMAEYDHAQMGMYIPPTPSHPRRPPTPTYDALIPNEQDRLRAAHEKFARTWHNRKCDALGLYNHLTLAWHTNHPAHAVFVTSDRNFRKTTKLAALRNLGLMGEVLSPAEAVRFLHAITVMTVEPQLSL